MVHVLLTALVLLLLAPVVVVVLWLIGVALYVAGFLALLLWCAARTVHAGTRLRFADVPPMQGG